MTEFASAIYYLLFTIYNAQQYMSLHIVFASEYNLAMNHQQLEKRLKSFALRVLNLVKNLPKTEENRIYGKQVIRSSSSIGANYAEAIYSHTRQDFIHAINISRKETNETLYWLEMIFSSNPNFATRMASILDENKQILKIFISSVKTSRRNKDGK